MARKIGDDYFDRMFPDQTQPEPPPRTPSLADKVVDFFFKHVPESTESNAEYEYKTLRVPGARANAKKNARVLNQLAAEGWEPIHIQHRHPWQFGTKDTVTMRRKR